MEDLEEKLERLQTQINWVGGLIGLLVAAVLFLLRKVFL